MAAPLVLTFAPSPAEQMTGMDYVWELRNPDGGMLGVE